MNIENWNKPRILSNFILPLIIIAVTVMYPGAKPSIKSVKKELKISYQSDIIRINENLYGVEILVSGDFKNQWIKSGFVNSINVFPRFMNVNTTENDKYIDTRINYILKKKISIWKKEDIRASIFFYFKNPKYFKNKTFDITFFDNYSKQIEFDDKNNSPAIIKYVYED